MSEFIAVWEMWGSNAVRFKTSGMLRCIKW